MQPAAVPVTLAASERKILKQGARGAKTPYRDRLRAQIVLGAARGRDNARIAAGLGICVNTVRKWRGRFAECGLAGLRDLPRSGRPRVISEADRAAVVALACQLPADTGVPLSRWTGPELKRELEARALVSAPVSVSSLLRFLAEDPVKPWQYQSWIFPRDPDFEAKANVILDLYRGSYGGKPLGAGDRILSFDDACRNSPVLLTENRQFAVGYITWLIGVCHGSSRRVAVMCCGGMVMLAAGGTSQATSATGCRQCGQAGAAVRPPADAGGPGGMAPAAGAPAGGRAASGSRATPAAGPRRRCALLRCRSCQRCLQRWLQYFWRGAAGVQVNSVPQTGQGRCSAVTGVPRSRRWRRGGCRRAAGERASGRTARRCRR
jgi:transposase